MNKIKELREKIGLPQKAFAADLGVSQPTISDWESGRKVPSAKSTEKIADYFGVSVDYVLGREDASVSEDVYRVPVLGRVAAGLPLYATQDIIDWEELPKSWQRKGDYFCLQIKGNSMEPRMCEGDIVVISQQDTCESGQTAIVMVNGDEATCKRVVFHDNGLSLLSNNPMYPPQFYTSEEVERLPVRIIGVVAELRAKIN